MNCPNCQKPMGTVKAPSSNPGFILSIDQCLTCGGLWFDRLEIYQLPTNEAINIENYNKTLLQQPAQIEAGLRCPKDNELLLTLKDMNIPKDIHISRCHLCEGVWLNRGELTKYKNYFQSKTDEVEKIEKEKKEKVYLEKEAKKRAGRIINNISNQFLMPLPNQLMSQMGYSEEAVNPFILSSVGIEVLKTVPKEKKRLIYEMMAQEHNEKIESENQFINATTTIINIIYQIIRLTV